MTLRAFPLAGLALLALALAAPAHAQQYPIEEEDEIEFPEGSTGAPGDQITFESDGWQAGSEADGSFASEEVEVGTFTADVAGVIRGVFTIPENATPGDHFLILRGTGADGQPREARGLVVVTGEDLAVTGSSGALPLIGTTVGLAVVGSVLVAIVRRRRAST